MGEYESLISQSGVRSGDAATTASSNKWQPENCVTSSTTETKRRRLFSPELYYINDTHDLALLSTLDLQQLPLYGTAV